MSEFTPSVYQQKIYDWFRSGSDCIAVSAVAGSGKTTTIVQGLHQAPQSIHFNSSHVLFAAFNKSIVEELLRRLPAGVDCRTIHSLGYATLRNGMRNTPKWDIDDAKYKVMAKRLNLDSSYGDPHVFRDAALSLLKFAQATLCPIDSESLADVADRFNIEIPPCGIDPLAETVSLFLKEGIRQAESGKISFGDMVWMPGFLEMQPATYGLVCVDEAQDLSKAQMTLIQRASNGSGRVIAVGDPRQAIYQFAGAESDSFHQIVRHFDAQQMPLSICYRCPSSVIAEAQKIVPQIECAPGSAPGIVDTITDKKFREMIASGDMVLCRTTAPLIKLCFELIGQRKQARIKGRDVAASLVNAVKQICNRQPFESFSVLLQGYRMKQLEVLEQKIGSESQQEALNDRCDALEVCYQSFQPVTKEGFISDIESLFSDQRAAITLSTVHRAKGLENARVFILHPEKLPLIWKGQTPEQNRQEWNLKYVAITRAQRELYFVSIQEKEYEISGEG